MLKKTILLAAAAGFALTTSAMAEGSLTKSEKDKANQTSTQMKKDSKGTDAKAMKPSTTGSGVTTADPRDSNAVSKTPAEKSRLEDAKQKP
jgi:hypothetical protein